MIARGKGIGAATVAVGARTGEPVVAWVRGIADNAAELLLAKRTSCQDSDCG